MVKLFVFMFILNSYAYANNKVRVDLSGNLDAQVKGIKNSEQAKDFSQNWDEESMKLIYSNVQGKVFFRRSQFNFNWFLRYSHSRLYEKDYIAPRFSVYPTNVIARDIFKLEKIDEADGAVSESILNEFNYQWTDSDVTFNVGRIFVDYGEGFVINPINPFMLPTGFSTLENIQQGNDGLKFYIQSDKDFRFHFYIFGDKQFTDYDGQITRTIMFRGDWDYSSQLHVNYILGEDQKRHKYGFELRYAFDQGQIFTQAVRNSQRLDKEDPADNGLFHYLVGYEKDLTGVWTGRLELGKFDVDNTFVEASYAQNFLPQKNFVALVNQLQWSDKLSFGLNASFDPVSSFSYFFTNARYQLDANTQFHIFMSGPMSRAKEEAQYAAQQVFAAEAGAGIRSQF